MKHKQHGIVIHAKDFSGSSLILSILTQNSIEKSLYKGGKKNNNATTGNHVLFEKFGNSNILGCCSCEVIKPYGVNYTDHNLLVAIMLICSEINYLLQKNYIYNHKIYDYFLEFLENSWDAKQNVAQIKEAILKIELEIVKESGMYTQDSINSSIFNLLIKKPHMNKVEHDIMKLRGLLFP